MNVMNKKSDDHSRISLTAKITAYWKSLSNIPYAKEIAEAVKAEQTARQMLGDKLDWMTSFSPPMLEARYKSINSVIRKIDIKNVMELACGLSPRGLEVVSDGGNYVGTDLPEMSAEGSKIIIDIAAQEGIPVDNLHFQPADVMNKDELENAAVYFNGREFAVICEGLLPYLSRDEKAVMAKNIKVLLSNKRGAWITADISFKGLREAIIATLGKNVRDTVKSVMQNISERTGSDISGNDFIYVMEAVKFYKDMGFRIEEYPMYTGDYELSASAFIPHNLKTQFLDILAAANVFVLTPAG